MQVILMVWMQKTEPEGPRGVLCRRGLGFCRCGLSLLCTIQVVITQFVITWPAAERIRPMIESKIVTHSLWPSNAFFFAST